jgi:hypothetical protein
MDIITYESKEFLLKSKELKITKLLVKGNNLILYIQKLI